MLYHWFFTGQATIFLSDYFTDPGGCYARGSGLSKNYQELAKKIGKQKTHYSSDNLYVYNHQYAISGIDDLVQTDMGFLGCNRCEFRRFIIHDLGFSTGNRQVFSSVPIQQFSDHVYISPGPAGNYFWNSCQIRVDNVSKFVAELIGVF